MTLCKLIHANSCIAMKVPLFALEGTGSQDYTRFLYDDLTSVTVCKISGMYGE